MGNPLFAKKPMSMLLAEAKETGEHSLKRTLGPFQLTALGVGAVIGAGIFVLVRIWARTMPGPGLMLSFVLSGLGCAFAGAVLCGICRDDSAGRQRLYVRVRHARRNLRVDYRLGLDARICDGREHGFFRLVEPLHRTARIFFTSRCRCGWPTTIGRRCALRKIWSPARWRRRPMHRWFPGRRLPRQGVRPSSPRIRRNWCSGRTTLMNAPRIFGMEIGFNLPAFVIALVITAILVVGIKESARFNADHRGHQSGCGAVRDRSGHRYISTANWGTDWHSASRPSASRESGPGRLTYFSRTSDSTRFPPPRRKRRIRSAILPIGIIVSLLVCTVLVHRWSPAF